MFIFIFLFSFYNKIMISRDMNNLKKIALKINQEKKKLIINPPPPIKNNTPPVIESYKPYKKWIIIITLTITILSGISIGLYIYFKNENLCINYNNALINYNYSLQKYNSLNILDNKNLNENQLYYKINYLEACKSLYESVNAYKGTDITKSDIFLKLQNDPKYILNDNVNINKKIDEYKIMLGKWDDYNSKSCRDLRNLNIVSSTVLSISLLSFFIFVLRKVDLKVLKFDEHKYVKFITIFIFISFCIIGIPLIVYYN